jgi:hypothetical protein
MSRRLFTAWSVLSLVLCLAIVVLWILSFRRPLVYGFRHHGDASQAVVGCGRIEISNSPAVAAEAAQRRRDLAIMSTIGGESEKPLLVLAPPKVSPWTWSSGLTVPLLALLLGLAPAFAVTDLIRRAAKDPSAICSACGYNLTGNTSGVCPECGEPTTVGSKA